MSFIYLLVVIALFTLAGMAYLLFRITKSLDMVTIELSKIAGSELLKYKLTPEPSEPQAVQDAYIESITAETRAAIRAARVAEVTRNIGRRTPMESYAQLDDV